MKILIILFFFGCGFCAENRSDSQEVRYNSFEQVVLSKTFVDKSGLIREFFQHRSVSITAPHRFGKSVNMDMIKSFCEVEVNELGAKVARDHVGRFRLFLDNNLIITQNKVFFHLHFGNYPVVHLDFKGVSGGSFKTFFGDLTNRIRMEYERHKYLLQNRRLLQLFRSQLNNTFGKMETSTISECNLKYSVQFLCESLFLFFRKRVIVLIDDYDSPVQRAIFEPGSETEKIINYLGYFTSGLLKGNTFVERALLNTRAKLSWVLSGYENSVEYYSFNDHHPFNKYFGITECEVGVLTRKLNLHNETDSIREWYGGYRVVGSGLNIYNTYSVLRYLESRVFENYWVQPDYYLKLEKFCSHDILSNKILSILMHNHTEVVGFSKISIEHLIDFKNTIRRPQEAVMDSERADLFLNIMLQLGYFTVPETQSRGNKVFYSLTIPNREVRSETERNLRKLNVSRDTISDSFTQTT